MLALKVIRKAVVHGLRKPHENPDVVVFLGTIVEQVKTVLAYSEYCLLHGTLLLNHRPIRKEERGMTLPLRAFVRGVMESSLFVPNLSVQSTPVCGLWLLQQLRRTKSSTYDISDVPSPPPV